MGMPHGTLGMPQAARLSSVILITYCSFGTATTAVLGSMGIVALILLLVGLLSMTLKKWKHKSKLSMLALELGLKKEEIPRVEAGQPWGRGQVWAVGSLP